MTLDFTTEICKCTLVMIEDLYLSIANKLLKHMGMPPPNRTASISTCVEWDHDQSYNTIDLLSYVTDRETRNINDDRNTQRETTDRRHRNTNDKQDTGNINDEGTGTQLQRGRRKGTWGIYN